MPNPASLLRNTSLLASIKFTADWMTLRVYPLVRSTNSRDAIKYVHPGRSQYDKLLSNPLYLF